MSPVELKATFEGVLPIQRIERRTVSSWKTKKVEIGEAIANRSPNVAVPIQDELPQETHIIDVMG